MPVARLELRPHSRRRLGAAFLPNSEPGGSWRCFRCGFRSFSIDSDDLQLFHFVEQMEPYGYEADNLDQFLERHLMNQGAYRSEYGQIVRRRIMTVKMVNQSLAFCRGPSKWTLRGGNLERFEKASSVVVVLQVHRGKSYESLLHFFAKKFFGEREIYIRVVSKCVV